MKVMTMRSRGGLTPESWSRLELLFEQALARPDGARTEFLAGACGDDVALRREVEALLDAHASTEGPLERLVVELGCRSRSIGGGAIGPDGVSVRIPSCARSGAAGWAPSTSRGGRTGSTTATWH